MSVSKETTLSLGKGSTGMTAAKAARLQNGESPKSLRANRPFDEGPSQAGFREITPGDEEMGSLMGIYFATGGVPVAAASFAGAGVGAFEGGTVFGAGGRTTSWTGEE